VRPKELAFTLLPMMSLAERAERVLQRRDLAATRAREDACVSAELAKAPPVEAKVVTVVATFRREQLVAEAVASALAQPIDSHAVVVVDDGGGQVPQFSDPRVRVVTLAQNVGICGVVRNVGIRVSRSEVLAFLDDDNTWTDEHLTTTLAELERGADAVYTGVRVSRPDGEVLRETSRPYERRALRHQNFIDASAIVARRSDGVLFSRLRRHSGGARQEDWELAYRLGRHGVVRHVPQVTVNYLANPASHYSQH
jgi:glycosyltransferase involved in cell wall biosynthesis